ncbi:O-unit flippase-like protein [Microbacter margulisiae]|uniref:O-antigen/teichoic acid export membrane protein n=1 Tax=Microbacter margulisiae TaxID=1350067 RepID=A0A7W5DS01_9PORP|nr:O-unit flippase-like protein [Microbacter margulisiae]MBB3187831.1 O-antigen/teichoic acid export membrane protein [Microbacter margulisiae]
MQIGRKDVAWNFAATFMRIASGLIVLPLVLRLLPSQEVGLWNIFLTIGSIAILLDFGFSNAFARNITYIFSGVKELKAEGYVAVDQNDSSIDYGLLRSVINAMRRYYGILAGAFLLLFILASPFYLRSVLEKYNGNTHVVWVAWFTYGTLVAYQLYTFYYGALLTGRGFVKKNMQIIVAAQSARIIITAIFLLNGLGLMSLVVGMFISDIINRTLSYLAFYDKEIKYQIKHSTAMPVRAIMKIMTPNAIKIGLTSVGGFLINKAVILIAPLYLSLTDIASYGTTKQFIDLIASIGSIWFTTYYPKMTLYRVNNEIDGVKRLYTKSKIFLIGSFIVMGTGLIIAGPPVLQFIHSKTHLLPDVMIFVCLIIGFLETNHGISGALLLTKNEVPFVKASLLSGTGTIILLLLGLKVTSLGIWSMLLAPGLAQATYQNWKWPLSVIQDLKLTLGDYFQAFRTFLQGIKETVKK